MSLKFGDHIGGVRHIGCIRDRCHVDRDTGCWIWKLSCVSGSETPQVRFKRKACTVRRVVLEMVGKPAPDDFKVVRRGTCDPKCVNPEHLTALSGSDHIRWMNEHTEMNGAAHAAARTRAVRSRPTTKVESVEQAEQIRIRAANGEDRGALAAEYGLSRSHLNRIARGKGWASKVTPVPCSVWSFAAAFTGKVRGQSFEAGAA